jgi:hypothetical protein
LSEASSADPAKREHRRLPRSAAKGSQTVGSPFLCLLSFGEAKESRSAAGPRPGLCPPQGEQKPRPDLCPKQAAQKPRPDLCPPQGAQQ